MKHTMAAALLFSLLGCSGPSGPTSGDNTLAVSVGQCGPSSYLNEPCASVTLCTPGTSSCQTIDHLLVDTGSFGVRVFGSLLQVQLPPEKDSGGRIIGECTPYADGTSDWGPVAIADVKLGADVASHVPVQVIDARFGRMPSSCGNPDISPDQSGYNGILGVGVFTSDCGPNCSGSSNNEIYYACSSGSCVGLSVPESMQVSNPIGFFSSDANGVGLTLPSIPTTGAPFAQGTLLLGVGTRSNNTPHGAHVFPTDGNGDFITRFSGQTYSSSFIDSGSNDLYFPDVSSLPECPSSSEAAGFFCPNSTVRLSALLSGANGSSQTNVLFQIISGQLALDSGNLAFSDIGAAVSDGFDWGLPFFYGKTIYFGLDGKGSSLGTGPYFAY